MIYFTFFVHLSRFRCCYKGGTISDIDYCTYLEALLSLGVSYAFSNLEEAKSCLLWQFPLHFQMHRRHYWEPADVTQAHPRDLWRQRRKCDVTADSATQSISKGEGQGGERSRMQCHGARLSRAADAQDRKKWEHFSFFIFFSKICARAIR